jgi:dihydrofolate reductase
MNRPAEIVIIAAVARNGAIGRGNALLFNEPADQRHFRETTLGCPVIMGRRTWDSLPARFRPLPGRRNVVVSRNAELQAQGAEIAADLETALARVAEAPRAFVIGGAQLYAQALPMAHTLVLTEIDADLDGDAFFPAWERSQFEQTGSAGAVTAAGVPYRFVTYRRRQAAACQHT